jgi:PAS domain S-box-containing protein
VSSRPINTFESGSLADVASRIALFGNRVLRFLQRFSDILPCRILAFATTSGGAVLDHVLDKIEAAAGIPRNGAYALLLFDGDGRLLQCAGGAAELLGLDPGAAPVGLTYEALLSHAKARAGEIAAVLPQQLPPAEEIKRGERVDRSGPQFTSTLFALGDFGYALVLMRTRNAATIAALSEVGSATQGGFAERASDWLWEIDAQWRFTYVDRRYETINDLPMASLLGRARWEVAAGDPKRDPLWHRHLDDLEARRPLRDFRYSDRDASGRMRHFCVSGDPIYAPDGSFAGYRGIARDETDEVEAHQRAASAERLLSAAIERLPDGFMLYDPSDRLVMANAEMRRRLSADTDILKHGRSFEEILHLCVERGLYAEAEGREQAFVAERMAAYRNTGGVFRFRRKGNRWIEARSARTEDGHTIVLLADITERVSAERTLIEFADTMAEKNRQADLARQAAERSEARFREFTELASDWEWEMDADARFTALSKRFNVPAGAVLGKTRWEVAGADPDTDAFWGRHRADYLAHRPFRHFRYSGRDPGPDATPLHQREPGICSGWHLYRLSWRGPRRNRRSRGGPSGKARRGAAPRRDRCTAPRFCALRPR